MKLLELKAKNKMIHYNLKKNYKIFYKDKN